LRSYFNNKKGNISSTNSIQMPKLFFKNNGEKKSDALPSRRRWEIAIMIEGV
jgi:hypothetical protein